MDIGGRAIHIYQNGKQIDKDLFSDIKPNDIYNGKVLPTVKARDFYLLKTISNRLRSVKIQKTKTRKKTKR